MTGVDIVEPALNGIVNWVYMKISSAFIALLNEFMSCFDASSTTFYALIGVTIVAIALIIALAVILSKSK